MVLILNKKEIEKEFEINENVWKQSLKIYDIYTYLTSKRSIKSENKYNQVRKSVLESRKTDEIANQVKENILYNGDNVEKLVQSLLRLAKKDNND